MLLKNEPLENRQVLLTIRVDKEDWQRALQELYNDCSSLYPVEGCAPGKATREQLEAAYGKDFLYQDAVNHTFPEAPVEAVAEANLQVAAAPDLSIVDIGPGGYIFTALVQLYPEVKLGQYKGLSAPMDPAELTERDGDEAVARWQQEHLHEEHPERAAMGDEVVLDFEGFVDGVAFDGGKGEKYPLLLGSGMFIPGFEEQVAGIRAGEERDVHVTFPQQYTPELAGKDATFHVKAHEINRRTAPELSDGTARRFGFENLAALRRAILEGAVRQKEAACRESFSDRLMAMVIAGMETEIPEVMVEGQLDGLMQELEQRLHQQGASLDDYLKAAGTTREALRDHAREQARHGVQVELALSEVARRENIHITDEELEQEYAQLSKEYQVPMERLREGLPPQRLTHDLRLARARAVIVDSAKALPGQPKN